MKTDFNNPCVFCLLNDTKRSVFHETHHFNAKLDEFALTRGHYMIIPKRHVVSMHDLTKHEWKDFQTAIKKSYKTIQTIDLDEHYINLLKNPVNEASQEFMENALHSPFKNQPIKDYNGGINEGPLSGRTVHHMHYHIIPRYEGDIADPTGGIRHILPKGGNYLK